MKILKHNKVKPVNSDENLSDQVDNTLQLGLLSPPEGDICDEYSDTESNLNVSELKLPMETSQYQLSDHSIIVEAQVEDDAIQHGENIVLELKSVGDDSQRAAAIMEDRTHSQIDILKGIDSPASIDTLPPVQDGKGDVYNGIYVCGASVQGESHSKRNIPCQDYNSYIFLREQNLLICGIADGLGSCKYSHWGAFTAVTTALDKLKKLIIQTYSNCVEITDCVDEIKCMLQNAMREARKSVEEFASKMNAPVPLFQSTLTLAIYDGANLAIGHIGDDGITVRTKDGVVELVTERHSGDTAGTVYPLQSDCTRWQIGVVNTIISGFVMSTDGILDMYVGGKDTDNDVYYPTQACFLDIARSPQSGSELKKFLISQLKESGKVTDDMTVLAVANAPLLAESEEPRFSKDEWEAKILKRNERINAVLYGSNSSQVQDKTAIDDMLSNQNEILTISPNCYFDHNDLHDESMPFEVLKTISSRFGYVLRHGKIKGSPAKALVLIPKKVLRKPRTNLSEMEIDVLLSDRENEL